MEIDIRGHISSWAKSLFKWLNSLYNHEAAIIIIVIGIAVFCSGFSNPFMGDDINQIVNSVPVHSLSNIGQFFSGGTFYSGDGLSLSGVYYRPLMTTVFSILYTMFGANPMPFHVLQIGLVISSAFFLYLCFCYIFKSALSLALALIFLVHPLSSQIAFAIPTLQDALFFFFGVIAWWTLLRFKSTRSLFVTGILLVLSFFSKETGLLFVVMSALYLFIWDRKRLYRLLLIMIIPLVFYFMIKINAVGLAIASQTAPINNLDLFQRLLTAPSILCFYILKFIFPFQLASGYYWVNTTFSFVGVLVPLLIDIVFSGLFVYLGLRAYKKLPRTRFYAYLFFAVWFLLGMSIHLQILVPLDMTVAEPWFYFPCVGLLGMIGIAASTYKFPKKPLPWIYLALTFLIILLGVRTFSRGFDWSSQYKLDSVNIIASPENYTAYTNLSGYLSNDGSYQKARDYAEKAVSIYPNYFDRNNLAIALVGLGEYEKARDIYQENLKYNYYAQTYENLASLTLFIGDNETNQTFIKQGLKRYPQDSPMWLYLAIAQARAGDRKDAKTSITNANKYGSVPLGIYNGIMDEQQFTVNLAGTGKNLTIY